MADPRYTEFLRQLPQVDFVFGSARPEGFLGGRQLVAGTGVTLNVTADEVEIENTGSSGTSLFTATARKDIDNTTTETTCFGSGEGSLTLAADYFTLGRGLLVTLSGFWSRANTGANACPTFRFKVGGTTIVTSVPIAVAGTVTGGAFALQLQVTAVAIDGGNDPDLRASGLVTLGLDGISFASMGCRMSNASDVFVSQAAPVTLDLTAQWPEANAGHLLQITNAMVIATDVI